MVFNKPVHKLVEKPVMMPSKCPLMLFFHVLHKFK